jgi:hypothetical protein
MLSRIDSKPSDNDKRRGTIFYLPCSLFFVSAVSTTAPRPAAPRRPSCAGEKPLVASPLTPRPIALFRARLPVAHNFFCFFLKSPPPKGQTPKARAARLLLATQESPPPPAQKPSPTLASRPHQSPPHPAARPKPAPRCKVSTRTLRTLTWTRKVSTRTLRTLTWTCKVSTRTLRTLTFACKVSTRTLRTLTCACKVPPRSPKRGLCGTRRRKLRARSPARAGKQSQEGHRRPSAAAKRPAPCLLLREKARKRPFLGGSTQPRPAGGKEPRRSLRVWPGLSVGAENTSEERGSDWGRSGLCSRG